LKEVELYRPVKDLLAGLGYNVKSEVAHMDVVATKDADMIVVEMKTSFTLKLLLQATQRQKLAEKVYIALPAPTGRQRFSKAFKEYEHLLRRLELGLILVRFTSPPRAEIVFEPKECARGPVLARNRKKRLAAISEAENRHDDYNVGGTNGKIITVYRENALRAAALLRDNGEMTVKQLREMTGCMQIQPLLYHNHYGWFINASRGVYMLSEAGEQALVTYCDVVEKLAKP